MKLLAVDFHSPLYTPSGIFSSIAKKFCQRLANFPRVDAPGLRRSCFILPAPHTDPSRREGECIFPQSSCPPPSYRPRAERGGVYLSTVILPRARLLLLIEARHERVARSSGGVAGVAPREVSIIYRSSARAVGEVRIPKYEVRPLAVPSGESTRGAGERGLQTSTI